MSKFHSLEVASVKQETSDAISISFKIPADLQQEYAYKQGQYLTIQAIINGEDVRRAYSLCSSPVTGEMPAVTCKRVDGGKMSNYLASQVKPGMFINVMPPQGRFFTEMDANNQKQYILVGGGSGITPLISIIKTVLLKEANSTCTLIYGNRNSASIIFKQELDLLQVTNPGRLNVIYSLDVAEAGWNGVTGLLTPDKISELIQQAQGTIATREYFLCGPEGLMTQARTAFNKLNLPSNHVHIEFFTAPVADKKVEEPKVEQSLDFEGSKVYVIIDGKETEIIIKDNKLSILHAAIKAGLDAPFSCEAGICSTCMAKVMEGTVRMDENNILSDEEVARGYVLTCQSHPTSKIVRLEYYD
jgi:ring-1,2-phenylacetyl-CoA epoxidase subunit PaaE